MIMRSSVRERDLFDIAQEQGGHFTAKQAARLGYTASKRNYHVGAGNWVPALRIAETATWLIWLCSCDRA